MAVNKKSIVVNDNGTITQGGKTYKNKEEYKNRDKGTNKSNSEKSLFISNIDKPKKRFQNSFKKAREAGKKIFKGDFSKSVPAGPGQVTGGKLEFSTMNKKEVANKIKKSKERSGRSPNDPRPAAKYEKATGTKVSSRGQAFAKARKEGRDSFTFNGKSYSTRLKGEKRPATPIIKSQAAKSGGMIRGYSSGGSVRGTGIAQRGFGSALKR